MDQKTLLQLAKTHGTPLVVVDHKLLRENYGQFQKYLPRVQVYYAVKANSDPAIVQTFYDAGASFDVASVAEFLNVHEKIKHLPAKQRQDFIWDRIIYPDGSSLDLSGMIGQDAHGFSGFRDKVDRHYTRLIGFAVLTSLFAAASEMRCCTSGSHSASAGASAARSTQPCNAPFASPCCDFASAR